jgi:hypothetical protein
MPRGDVQQLRAVRGYRVCVTLRQVARGPGTCVVFGSVGPALRLLGKHRRLRSPQSAGVS